MSEDYSIIPHFQKALKRFLKVIDCTQQLEVWENVVGFEKALGAVKVIKDQIQYRSQSLLNLARGYFRIDFELFFLCEFCFRSDVFFYFDFQMHKTI